MGEWAYDRLQAAGWPSRGNAPVVVVNELMAPLLYSAGLRSLGCVGRADLVEEELVHSKRVWFAMKCIQQYRRLGYFGPVHARRIDRLIERSEVERNWCINNVIEEMRVAQSGKQASPNSCGKGKNIEPVELSYDDAVGWLRGADGLGGVNKESSIVLSPAYSCWG